MAGDNIINILGESLLPRGTKYLLVNNWGQNPRRGLYTYVYFQKLKENDFFKKKFKGRDFSSFFAIFFSWALYLSGLNSAGPFHTPAPSTPALINRTLVQKWR